MCRLPVDGPGKAVSQGADVHTKLVVLALSQHDPPSLEQLRVVQEVRALLMAKFKLESQVEAAQKKKEKSLKPNPDTTSP